MSEWGTTNRVRVSVRLATGEELEGNIHLLPQVPHHNGPETPLDLLDRPDQFFPLALTDGTVLFVSKAQVAVVTCNPTPPESELDRLGISRFIPMEASLVDGTVCRGEAGVTLPPTRHRALDCLNASRGFLILWTEDGAFYLNRAHVRVVRPLE